MKVLVLDNYDSFTYNLVQYLGELGADVHVVRNDRATVEELLAGAYDRCVVSPGPCTPEQAGITLELVRRMPEAGVPTLGVCLGHQAIGQEVAEGAYPPHRVGQAEEAFPQTQLGPPGQAGERQASRIELRH